MYFEVVFHTIDNTIWRITEKHLLNNRLSARSTFYFGIHADKNSLFQPFVLYHVTLSAVTWKSKVMLQFFVFRIISREIKILIIIDCRKEKKKSIWEKKTVYSSRLPNPFTVYNTITFNDVAVVFFCSL